METVFLIGDSTHWLYLCTLAYQGSTYPGSDTNFWDLCALRVLAPVAPLPQSGGAILSCRVLLDHPARATPVTSVTPVTPVTPPQGPSTHAEGRWLLHPLCTPHSPGPGQGHSPFGPGPHGPSSPPYTLCAITVAQRKVAVDQVVRLLGFPGNKELSVDWGRVVQNNPNGDILITLLSDDGSSGGPVVDREGRVIGLLSRSHEFIKYSCVQHLRNLFHIVRTENL
ncbi:hypothetical protein B484DRAFT_454160 [Ochromonadaceae sp. CCMP2298]|nr:hypothetical protein B484DRAFT_454160 [Ochromonadaceae sp. CCMP2298]